MYTACSVPNIALPDGNEVIWSKVKVNWRGVTVVLPNHCDMPSFWVTTKIYSPVKISGPSTWGLQKNMIEYKIHWISAAYEWACQHNSVNAMNLIAPRRECADDFAETLAKISGFRFSKGFSAAVS